MSVILFSPQEVYKDLADSYESLKGFMRLHAYMVFNEEADGKFYKALRRMYYANVACFLCQYHDDTPLGEDELKSISTFQELQGDIMATEFQTLDRVDER
jgi:hypothetical protein